MMKKLLEAMTKFAGEPEQKPGEQWKGTDKDTPGKKLVGDSIIKDLSKGPTAKTKEQQLAEEFAKFMEDDLGVEPKRPHRTGSRAEKVGARGHKEQPRYTTVKDEVDEATAAGLKVGDHITANTSKGEYPGGHKSRAGKVTRVGQTGVHIRPDDGGEIEYHPYKIVKKTVKDKDVYETTEAEYDRDELFRKHDAETDELGVVGIGGEFAAMAKAKKAKRDKDLDEGWNTGSDRVHLSDDSMAYWNGKGRLQAEYDELYNQLVPASGAAETIQGEVLRAASKIVYRHFNDGDEFNKASFDQLKAYIGQVTSYDDLAEKAVEFALNAEGRYTPNRGWDSLDVMDYGPTDDNDGWDEEDEYDDEDDTSWDEEEDELEEGMEEFAKAQAKKRAEKRKSIPWPKEVPTDAEQERNRTRDEEENDPHPYTQVGEGEHDAEFIDHEDNWYNMADWARAEFKKGKSVEEVIKYLRDNDYLGPRDINNFMKTVSGEKWNESADMFKAGQRAIKNIKSATQQRKSEAEKMAMAQSQIDADRENERDRFSQEELYPSDDSHDLDEGAADVYSITSERNGRERSKSGTLAELIEYYGYTLETGKSYEHERGNRKINLNPKSIESLVQNLNNAKSNAAANGRSNERFYVDHGNMAEGKHFRTAYGWAGGRNEKTGKMYKHPDQIKADREAKKAATAQQSKDAFNDMLGGNAADLTRDLKIREGWEADLAKSNRERMKKERAAAKPMKPIAKAKPNYDRVFQDINSAIGDTFPDGDPIDALMRKYRDSYGDLNIDLLNKACRVNGAKSYHDYVAKVWQQHMQDNPDLVQGGNPWIAENDHPQHYVDRYNKDLERKIDKDFDPDYDRKMSDQEFEAKLKQRGKERDKGVAEGLVKDIKRLATGKDVKSRAGQEIAKSQDAIMKGDTKTSKKHFDRYDKLDKLANKGQGVAEGWESGPEERTTRERDPDAEYDARRQEKLDAEADNAPKTTTYQCVGRGPNDEPNYKFGPEHNTSEEAVAYRKKLMANPKTPNPRDIGIRTISKVAKGINEDVTSTDPLEGALLDAIHELIGQGHTDVDPMVLTNMVVAATSRPFLLKDLVDANNNSQAVQHYIDSISPSKVKFSSDMLTVKNEDPAKDKAKAQAGVSSMASRAANRNRLGEGTETPLRDKEDYNAKRKALQQIQMTPGTEKDPQLKAELARRLHSLNQQYSTLHEQISKFKESRGHKIIATKLGNMDRMQNVQIPTPAERQEQLRIAKAKEETGKKQVKEFAAPGANPAAPAGTTAPANDPIAKQKAQQIANASNTIKSATGSSVAAPVLATALDAASKGQANPSQVKAIAPVVNIANAAAKDPKLAGQFKTLANQAKTS